MPLGSTGFIIRAIRFGIGSAFKTTEHNTGLKNTVKIYICALPFFDEEALACDSEAFCLKTAGVQFPCSIKGGKRAEHVSGFHVDIKKETLFEWVRIQVNRGLI